MWIRGGVELQQIWPWQPRGGPRPREKVQRPSFEVGVEMKGTEVVAEMKEEFPQYRTSIANILWVLSKSIPRN